MFINRLEKFSEKYFIVFLLVICLLAGINLFYNLDNTPVEDWDESRHGVTAFEMLQNKEYIVTTYNNNVDYWNLKPPLGAWLIALSYKIFGFSVFALRFPSAFSALLTVLIAMVITKKQAGSLSAIVAGIVLATTTSFISAHSGRTGDYDAIFTLFTFVCLIFLYLAKEKQWYLYFSALFLSLAILLKSYAAIQIFAVAFLYLAFTKQLLKISLRYYFYSAVIVILPVLLWAIARFKYDGFEFFKQMWIADVLKRSTETIEGHSGGLFYYIQYIHDNNGWVYLLLVTILLGLTFIRFYEHKFLFFCMLSITVPIVLFSVAESKLYWYINTTYPFMSLLIGCLFVLILRNSRPIIKILMVLLFAVGLYKSQAQNIHEFKNVQPYSTYAILKQFYEQNNDPNVFVYMTQGDQQAQLFMSKVVFGRKNTTYTTKEEFISSGQGYIILPISDKEYIKSNDLTIVLEDSRWLIARK